MVVAGLPNDLSNLANGSYQTDWENILGDSSASVSSIGNPDPRIIRKQFSDTEPPQFVENYPSIAAGDIGAEIDVMLDRPGQVYYVAVPLSNFKKGSQDFAPTGQLKFSDLAGVTSYTTPVVPEMAGWGLLADNTSQVQNVETGLPLPQGASAVPQVGGKKATEPAPIGGKHDRMMLSAPGVNTITGGKFSGKVRYGSTPALEANVGYTITLQDLDPNTLYYVYLVTKGTSAIYSRFAECYAFITQESVRPNINASISGTNVNITVDRTTELDYILVRSGNEDAELLKAFWGNSAMTDIKSDSDVALNNYPNVKTVLDALTTPFYNNGVYAGSLFDQYANIRGKEAVADLIRNQEVTGTTVVMTGSKRVTEAGNGGAANRITCTGMLEGSFYTFLAVGKSALGSGDAFRAVRPVEIADTEPPMITSAIIKVDRWVKDANGKNTPQIAQGTISLVFSEGLYSNTKSGTEQTTLPVDGCALNSSTHGPVTAKKYAALGSIITTSENAGVTVRYESTHAEAVKKAPISVVELNVTKVQSGFGISFANTVCDKDGNGLNRTPLTVKVQVTKRPGTGTAEVPVEYDASLTVTASWDARTDK